MVSWMSAATTTWLADLTITSIYGCIYCLDVCEWYIWFSEYVENTSLLLVKSLVSRSYGRKHLLMLHIDTLPITFCFSNSFFFCTKCSVPAFSVDVVMLRYQYNKISHLNFEWPNTAHSIIQIHFSSWYQPSVTLILPLCRAHVRSDIFRTKTSIKFIDSHSTSWLSQDEYFDGLNCWINLVYLDL